MGKIALLPDEVASQVAAGEVVERPASVVKELVENSLDAGADRIEVAIGRGGASLIRVVDNGAGMDRDDALLSLERHATSKIRSGADLARISTLGFRGEALPSIASVARFRLVTRPPGTLEGTEIIVNAGKIESVRVSGEAPGTTVEVRSLFYNLPARRKFLRSEATEAHHVQHQLLLQAIGHFQAGFVYVRDQALVFQAPPARALVDRIRDLRGSEIVSQLLEIEAYEEGGLAVRGYLGKPGVSRATRVEQIIFVNGRPVENSVINQGLREGYHTALMKGQYPVTFLFLELSATDVDVNVHPAKREVRFRDPMTVRNVIANAVRKTLEADRPRWSAAFTPPERAAAPASEPPPAPRPGSESQPLIPPAEQFSLRKDWAQLPSRPHQPPGEAPEVPASAAPETAAAACPAPVEDEPGPEPGRRSETAPVAVPSSGPPVHVAVPKVLGVLGKLYVLMENNDGLVLLDQHAAHERILFERLRRQIESEGVPSQRLLIPITVQITPKDYDWIRLNLESLSRMGFALEPFGEATLKIDAVPQFFKVADPAGAMRRLVDELRSMTASTSRLRIGEDVIAKTVCRHAVKANDELRPPEIQQLVRDLLACDLPYCCPHGRPTLIQISYLELEKKFGRKT
ncbi:MAG: DNA mismatch repair endonuclease MutL [Verrucomicrobia bacterium]|nr:DNA mismatch repair endonuclease MutL [Verrucomicrobiota bacterium]